jgi:hypothetical protein
MAREAPVKRFKKKLFILPINHNYVNTARSSVTAPEMPDWSSLPACSNLIYDPVLSTTWDKEV